MKMLLAVVQYNWKKDDMFRKEHSLVCMVGCNRYTSQNHGARFDIQGMCGTGLTSAPHTRWEQESPTPHRSVVSMRYLQSPTPWGRSEIQLLLRDCTVGVFVYKFLLRIVLITSNCDPFDLEILILLFLFSFVCYSQQPVC